MKKWRRLVEQAVAEIPDAGERGQRIVEADHHAQRGDGIGQHVLAQGTHGHVEQPAARPAQMVA
jgi:hypothetical protein